MIRGLGLRMCGFATTKAVLAKPRPMTTIAELGCRSGLNALGLSFTMRLINLLTQPCMDGSWVRFACLTRVGVERERRL